MRVFLSVTSLRPEYGGPARSVSRTAIALSNAGADVGVWAPNQSAPDSPFLADAARVQKLGGSLHEALARFGRADVLHDNGIWLRHHHALARFARATSTRRIVSTRGMLEPWAYRHKGFKKRAAWWLYQRRDLMTADGLHATAPREAAHLEQLRLDVPAHVIPNGVDMPAARARARGEGVKTAIFMGRLYPVKGLPMLIEAWARVRPAGWRLRIAGPDEGGHRAVLERLVREARLGGDVTFTGPLDGEQKTAALQEADLFVLPSHTESFGMAAAEALAHGLPVLTTTAAPWPMLEREGCGWQVPPETAGIERGLREATALAREQLYDMGERGRRMAARDLDWDGVAERLITMYDDTLRRA